MEKDTKMDGTVEALDIAPASQPCTDIVPTSDPIPSALPLQAAFWTSCPKCRLALEYPMVYRHRLLHCPHCHKPFEAKEKSLISIIGQSDSSAPHAPSDQVAAKCIEALPCTQSSSVPKIFPSQSHHGVSMHGVLLGPKNGSIMLARHKRQREDMSETVGAGYKVQSYVSNDASFGEPIVQSEIRNDKSIEKPLVLPEIPERASPQEVAAELDPIRADLSNMEWLIAFNMLRFDKFQLRSLKAIPTDLKKEWLLNEIK